MADVARLPTLPEQIRLVAGLRWRILRNGLKTKARVWDLIGLVISSIVGVVFVGSLSIVFFSVTMAFLRVHREARLGLLFWGIFLWWQVLPIFVAGFSPSFSFRSLLRFPMSFPAFYLIGIAYGLADSAAMASIVWLFTMTVAVAIVNISLLPAMILACALFVAANVTLERLVGSWVEKILSKRRAREVFLALFVMLMVSLQFLNPILQKYGRSARPEVEKVGRYSELFPASLPGKILAGSGANDFSAVALGTAGLAGYALFFGGLLLARYRTQYRGEELSETVAPKRISAKRVTERRDGGGPEIRFLPVAVAVMLKKEIRYVLRNGFASMTLLFPPMLVFLFSLQFGGAHPTVSNRPLSPDLFFPAVMGYVVLALIAPSYNVFAFEGRGMQTYFMLPVKFRDVLLGKNLMLAAILSTEILLCAIVLAWRGGLPSAPTLFATFAALVFSVVGQLALANWSSLSFPKKMEFGKMQGQRQSGMAVLIAFSAQIVFGVTCGLVLFAGRVTGNPWLPLAIFVFLAAAAVAGYVASLDPLTKVAEKKKEAILEILMK